MKGQTASWNYRNEIVKFLESTRNKTYTIIGLTFLSLILFGAFAIRPTIATIFKLQTKIESGERIEKNMQNKINTLTTLQQQLYKYEKELNLLETYLPKTPEIDNIIGNLQLIAEKYKLKITSIKPVTTSKSLESDFSQPNIQTKGFTINLKGKPEDFYNFIKNIETLPRVIYIENISYANQKNGKEYNFSITLYFFYSNQ